MYLTRNNILNKTYYNPIHLTKLYRGYNKNPLPNTVEAYNNSLNIPMYPTITCDDVDYISDKIHDFFR